MARRILFVSEGADTSPTRYRALAYFDRLRAAGWEPGHFKVVGLWRRMALLQLARQANVIVVLRKAFSPTFCAALRGSSGRRRPAPRTLIYDIDDALFASDDGHANPRAARRFARMAASVDEVWAGNDYLAYQAARHTAVTLIPTSVDLSDYAGLPVPHDPSHFDLVWIGSSATRKYLESALPMLAEASRQIPTLRLKIVADFDLPAARAMGIATLAVPWSEETQADALRSADVGIAPLPDDPWTRGKCGLKIIQCMATALPVIASPVGAQTTIVKDRYTGFLAGNPADWVEALRILHQDLALRGAMGTAGRARAATHFATEATFPKMLAALEALVAP